MTHTHRADAQGVHTEVVLQSLDLAGGTHRLDADFGYDPADPFAVTVTFRTDYGPVAWTFARDLLVDGLTTPSGDGDVHVWPCLDADGSPVVMIELVSDDGELMAQAPMRTVRRFVEQALDLVPVGTESDLVDLDLVVARLLGRAAA